jgi:long-chain acyl-CoA synthetase
VNLAAAIDPHPDDAPALISRGTTTTYGELRSQVGEIRGGLVARGVEPDDHVAIVAANDGSFVAAYLAVLGVGAVALPLNPASPAAELERQLRVADTRLALVGPTALRAFDGVDVDRIAGFDGGVAIGELRGAEPAPLVERADGDLAVLLFTSGTGGLPLAAMLTHGNLRANIDQVRAHGRRAGVEVSAGDVALAVIPLFHVFGLNALLGQALTAGAAVVLVEQFEPQSALELVAEHGVTVLSGVPTMWRAWTYLPDLGPNADPLASVRVAVSGAAALEPALRHAVAERFGVELAEGYGLTEASPVVTSGVGVHAPDASIGVPLPGVQVRLIDGAGEDALVGDPGEIWVKGPNVFAGYWNDADATRAVLGDDGWLRTGDLAVVDDDGYLCLVDRVKDVIIVSGFNVVPAEVEAVLVEHPDVADAAVVGVPHPHSGEAVKAFVVPVDGASIEEDVLIDHASRYLARYKCPTTIAFVDELPHGITGKLIRRALQ